MENQYFVQIRDPIDVRKGLLENSKQIIQVLQRYERIKHLRVKKLEKITQLKDIHRAINLLVVKLKKQFPQVDFRVPIQVDERKKNIPSDELRKLEAELKMIEDKIGMLS